MIRTVALTLFTATASLALVIAAHVEAQSQAFPNTPRCFRQLQPLAKRLGVRPTLEANILVAAGCDGKQYDIIALLNAFLDKMDKHK